MAAETYKIVSVAICSLIYSFLILRCILIYSQDNLDFSRIDSFALFCVHLIGNSSLKSCLFDLISRPFFQYHIHFLQHHQRQDPFWQPLRCRDRHHPHRLLLPLHRIAKQNRPTLLHLFPSLILWGKRVVLLSGLGGSAKL
jgi:hypothetical protein